MPKLMMIMLLLLLGPVLTACSTRDVQDTVISATGNAIRGNCERAGNCEVHCKSADTIKTHDGRCVGE
ncbi:MAG: hypothetical protein AAF299_05680 [Pseudomonadota bacterium]